MSYNILPCLRRTNLQLTRKSEKQLQLLCTKASSVNWDILKSFNLAHDYAFPQPGYMKTICTPSPDTCKAFRRSGDPSPQNLSCVEGNSSPVSLQYHRYVHLPAHIPILHTYQQTMSTPCVLSCSAASENTSSTPQTMIRPTPFSAPRSTIGHNLQTHVPRAAFVTSICSTQIDWQLTPSLHG